MEACWPATWGARACSPSCVVAKSQPGTQGPRSGWELLTQHFLAELHYNHIIGRMGLANCQAGRLQVIRDKRGARKLKCRATNAHGGSRVLQSPQQTCLQQHKPSAVSALPHLEAGPYIPGCLWVSVIMWARWLERWSVACCFKLAPCQAVLPDGPHFPPLP